MVIIKPIINPIMNGIITFMSITLAIASIIILYVPSIIRSADELTPGTTVPIASVIPDMKYTNESI